MEEQVYSEIQAQSAPMDQKGAGAERKKENVQRADVIAALASYLIAFAYVELIVMHELKWGYIAFVPLFLIGVELYCRAKGRGKMTRESSFFALSLLCVGAARVLFSGCTVMGYDTLFLHALALYYGLCRTGRLSEGITGPLLPCDMVSAGVLLPLRNLFLRMRMLMAARRERDGGRGENKAGRYLIVSAALVLGAGLFFLAARILSRADPFFEASVGRFLSANLSFSPDVLVSLLLSLPVGSYLFGSIGGAMISEKPPLPAERVRAAVQKVRVVPCGAAAVVVSAFLLLYALFFCFQGSYLLGAMRGALPVGFTAAEYARQGFFELCEIVSLNFLLYFALLKTAKQPLRESVLIRTISLLLLLSSLLFAAIGASKMALYIARFGMTGSRLIASFFMLLLALFTLLAAIDILHPFRAVRTGVLLAVLLFSLLCLSDPDARIIEINLLQYKSGRTAVLDVGYLAECCGAREDPVLFFRQLDGAGYFQAARTEEDLICAFGGGARTRLPDGTETLEWQNARGEAVTASLRDGTVLDIGSCAP